jgi:xanthine dioxygenase
VTGALHFQVHPCGAQELLVDPLPEGASRQGALYPDGAHIKDLKEVRDLLYKMQRPAIAPSVRVLSPPPPFISLLTTYALLLFV